MKKEKLRIGIKNSKAVQKKSEWIARMKMIMQAADRRRPSRPLSMDEFLVFNFFYLKHMVGPYERATRSVRKLPMIPFRFKPDEEVTKSSKKSHYSR